MLLPIKGLSPDGTKSAITAQDNDTTKRTTEPKTRCFILSLKGIALDRRLILQITLELVTVKKFLF